MCVAEQRRRFVMKKGLSILIVMTMLLSMLPVTTAAVVPVCVPDEHQFIYDHDDADSNSYYKCNACEEPALWVKNLNGLKAAVDAAGQNEILLLGEGTYTLGG